MPKLILKFEAAVLKEVTVGPRPITIGRAPDNDIQIDNLAVSSHHARVFMEESRLVLEDLNSLNGTFVNNQKVQRVNLKQADQILIGKHHLVIEMGGAVEAPAIPEAKKVVAPKVEETMVLDTKKRKEMLQQALASGAAPAAAAPAAAAPGSPHDKTQPVPPAAPPPRARVATLVIIDGKTDQREYLLSSKLTVIGKSDMATIKIKGWFKPKVAAQINKREDGYFIGPADKVPTVNGQPIHGPTKLNEGDMIEVAGVKMNFVFKD
ncbi:MAG: FHA domain-containing protein [Acidobacteria bacterium]|nr:FHA domain-containing protein [Acidobacteriota bacterium]MCL5287793.1 FHA domain-containing protein [Acidobacteriota bacterium]